MLRFLLRFITDWLDRFPLHDAPWVPFRRGAWEQTTRAWNEADAGDRRFQDGADASAPSGGTGGGDMRAAWGRGASSHETGDSACPRQ